MSSIPSNPIASALQADVAQREQSRDIDAARTAQAEAARRATASPDAFVEIEAADADSQVHTDSGGLGSQGRYDARPDEEQKTDGDESGVTTDESGNPHIDLSA